MILTTLKDKTHNNSNQCSDLMKGRCVSSQDGEDAYLVLTVCVLSLDLKGLFSVWIGLSRM